MDPLLRVETTTNIKLLTLSSDIVNKGIMDDKLSAAAAGAAFLTVKTRDNMNTETNTKILRTNILMETTNKQ